MRKVLIISPHMDDEVLGVGGVISKYVAEGSCVKVCFVCNRAYDHVYDPELIDKEKENVLEAKKILGYQDHYFLDLNDENLDDKLIDIIVPLEKVINEYLPEIVYIPYKGDNNQDHRAISQASMVAMRSFSSEFVKEIYAYEVLSSTEQAAPYMENIFVPTKYVDISGHVKKKQEALNCYKRELRDFPHPRSIKAVEVWSMKRGMEAHLEHAEAFSVIRWIDK